MTGWWVAVAAVLVALAALGWWRERRWGPASVVEVDGEGVLRFRYGRLREAVRWTDLVRVSIVTTDAGPYVEDFYLLLHAADGTGCAVGLNQAVEVRLLELLQRLPGFDNEAVVRASGSAREAMFTCWTGSPGDARPIVEAFRSGEEEPRATRPRR